MRLNGFLEEHLQNMGCPWENDICGEFHVKAFHLELVGDTFDNVCAQNKISIGNLCRNCGDKI